MSDCGGVEDWSDLMGETVTVQPFQGRSSYGAASYGSPQVYPARIERKTRLLRANTSEQAVAKGKAWLGTVATITTQDRITLPDGSTPLLLDVDVISDENGPHHTVLYFA